MSEHRRSLIPTLVATGITVAALVLATKTFATSSNSSNPAPHHHAKLRKRSIGHTVEIMVTDIESAKQAIKGGANSLELCANRVEGGTTPSIGFIEEVVALCRSLSVEVNILVRPRPGDFLYSQSEFDLIQRDIIAANIAGATGIVVGIMTEDGHIDVPRMKVLRELTRDMKLTFHRAFDLCVNYEKAIEDIASIGCDRLLTSGQEKYAHLACQMNNNSNNNSHHKHNNNHNNNNNKLRTIVSLANNRFHVVAGAGITIDNVSEIIRQSKVPGVHCSSGVNTTVLTSLNIDQTLETPAFTMAAEMKVWKGVKETLVNTLAERAWEAWIELEYEKEKQNK
jgi:copper homeostasis protein